MGVLGVWDLGGSVLGGWYWGLFYYFFALFHGLEHWIQWYWALMKPCLDTWDNGAPG